MHHGRPRRSNSFDLGNWKAAAAIAQQVAKVQGDRHRRGSFKQDRSEGGLPGMSPQQMRRKVSFSGQLPQQHPCDTSGTATSGSTTPSALGGATPVL